jgi:transposase
LIYNKTIVEIYHGQRRIAFHDRVFAYGYSTIKEHMPSSHQYLTDWNPNRFISWARGIGENTEEYIVRVLEKKQHPEQCYKNCVGILGFAKKAGNMRLENACKRALGYERYGLQAIKDILDRGLGDLFDDEDFFQQKALPKHHNIRGGSIINSFFIVEKNKKSQKINY